MVVSDGANDGMAMGFSLDALDAPSTKGFDGPGDDGSEGRRDGKAEGLRLCELEDKAVPMDQAMLAPRAASMAAMTETHW